MYTMVNDAEFASFIGDAYRRVPAVRRKLDEAGVSVDAMPPMAELLASLSVTRKDELTRLQKEEPPFGGWAADDLAGIQRVFVSPGPIYNIEGTGPDDWGGTEAFRAAGFGPGDLVLNTFSYHLSPASFIVEEALFALGAAVIPSGTVARSELTRLMAHLPVTGFAGLPSYLRALLEAVREEAAGSEARDGTGNGAGNGAGVPRTTLKRAWFTAERLDDEFRRELLTEWGIEAFQGYGTAEHGIIAYECSEAAAMHLSDGVIVELLDPETRRPVPAGDIGELVITALRPAYPLLRLATGDLSAIVLEPCPCGRPGPRLAGVLGRVGSGVKVRGMFVYPHQIDELAKSVPAVARIAVTVRSIHHRDELILDVECTGSAPDELEEQIGAAARDRLRIRPDIVRVYSKGELGDRPLLVDERSERPA